MICFIIVGSGTFSRMLRSADASFELALGITSELPVSANREGPADDGSNAVELESGVVVRMRSRTNPECSASDLRGTENAAAVDSLVRISHRALYQP